MRRSGGSTRERSVRSSRDMDGLSPGIQPLPARDFRVAADKSDNECRQNTPSTTLPTPDINLEFDNSRKIRSSLNARQTMNDHKHTVSRLKRKAAEMVL